VVDSRAVTVGKPSPVGLQWRNAGKGKLQWWCKLPLIGCGDGVAMGAMACGAG
jgi:hypothetical protein